ncbi:MAG: phosphoglucosamine mutase [Eubacterium sp.]|nr:phosphoglucosamine mutase [Eubacterium sp.]
MKYFGTDGFRGEAGVSLTAEHAYKVGRFLGAHFGSDDHRLRIVIGKDTRISGYMLENALVAGITASGGDAYEMYVTTTPSISYMIRRKGFDCGVMISASHNPYYDNGIKIIDGGGFKLSAEIEEMIERYIDEGEPVLPECTRDKIGKCYDYSRGKETYTDYLEALVRESIETTDSSVGIKTPFSGRTVALDLSEGSAYRLAIQVFEDLGAQVIPRHHEPNGININKNCGSTHIETLQELVYDTGAQIGFAYDGDADRCLAVDDDGNVIDGDHILYLCARYMQKYDRLKHNTVVTTVMSNIGLYRAFDELGINYEQTAVGDKYVSENMMQNDYRIGGEQSGHIIFKDHAVTGDGILTSLMIMLAWIDSDMPISELVSPLTIYPQLLENVRVADKQAALSDPDVIKTADDVSDSLGNRGRLLLRESGTEPLIRVMVEAETDELCRENVNKVVEILKSKGYAIEK